MRHSVFSGCEEVDQPHSNWDLCESVSFSAGASRTCISVSPGLVLMCGATCCGWVITTRVWRMSLRGSCPWSGSSSTGTTGLAAMIMTLPWSGWGAERGTVSHSIAMFCLSACLTGKRSLTSTGKPASSLAGETQVSEVVWLARKVAESGLRSPHGPLTYVCTTQGHVLTAPICLCWCMVLRSGEVIFVPLSFLLILRLLEPSQGGSSGCHSIPLKLLERVMLPSGHSSLFLSLFTYVLAHSRPLRQQPMQSRTESMEAAMFPSPPAFFMVLS